MARVVKIVPYLLIVVIYAAFRLVHLDKGLHYDESFWLGRSLNFYRALVTREWEFTYQREHPGVITMWAGAIAYWIRFPEVANLASANIDNPFYIANRLWEWQQNPLEMLTAARFSKVVMQTVFFALSLGLFSRVIGKSATLLTGLLIALSPTLLHWDSWLHLDGVAAITAFAAIAALACASDRAIRHQPLERTTLIFWTLAGALSATAWLSRVTLLVLVAVVAVALLTQVYYRTRSVDASQASTRREIRYALVNGLYWILGAIAATFALLPALWVQPWETTKNILWLPIAGALGFGPSEFFTDGTQDGGWLYFPQELIYRSSPFTWLGIGALLILLWVGKKRRLVAESSVRVLALALVFAVLFLTGNSLSPKKFGRYIMPIYPLLILAGSIGLIALSDLIGRWKFTTARLLKYSLPLTAVVFSFTIVVSALPYRPPFTNPVAVGLFGEHVSLSQVEGQDQVFGFILAQSEDNAIDIRLISQWHAYPYFVNPDSPITLRNYDIDSVDRWLFIDYDIVNSDSVPGIYRDATPVFETSGTGTDGHQIYTPRTNDIPSELLGPSMCNWNFDNRVELVQVVARDNWMDLYFLSFDEGEFQVEITRNTKAGELKSVTQGFTSSAPGTIVRVHVSDADWREIEDSAKGFTMKLYNSDGTRLDTLSPLSGSESSVALVRTDCYSVPASAPQSSAD